ncbi:MAG: hypothetical protein U5K84_04955 [Alkalibacterium sp.]|nr:hypothetical protein [Alkalibacterium sp.]
MDPGDLTLPRRSETSVMEDSSSSLFEELEALRKQSSDYLEDVYGKTASHFRAPGLQEFVIAWHEAASSFSWTLRSEVTVNYDSAEKRVTVERTNWATGSTGNEKRDLDGSSENSSAVSRG